MPIKEFSLVEIIDNEKLFERAEKEKVITVGSIVPLSEYFYVDPCLKYGKQIFQGEKLLPSYMLDPIKSHEHLLEFRKKI